MSNGGVTLSEAHAGSPRVSSSYSRAIYDEMIAISNHINFNDSIFMGRLKRSHSISSVQAFIVELALTNESFCTYLREFMVNGGIDWSPIHARKYPKYNSPQDVKKAQQRFEETGLSIHMWTDRDNRKLIDPPAVTYPQKKRK